MKLLRDIIGYLLGLVLFVGLMPTLMWLASGRPVFWSEVAAKDVVAWGLMLCGLLLSIWTIVYMKRRGKGNPMDAFGHEVAPSSSLPSCLSRYSAKSAACIVTLAMSMMFTVVTLEGFNDHRDLLYMTKEELFKMMNEHPNRVKESDFIVFDGMSKARDSRKTNWDKYLDIAYRKGYDLCTRRNS